MEHRCVFLLRREYKTGQLDLDSFMCDEWPFTDEWTDESVATLKAMHPEHPWLDLLRKYEKAASQMQLRARMEGHAMGPYYMRCATSLSRTEALDFLLALEAHMMQGRRTIGTLPVGYMFDHIQWVKNHPEWAKPEEITNEDQ